MYTREAEMPNPTPVSYTHLIYVLEAGRVAEAGKHNELLAKNGVYSRLWNVQYELENYGFKDNVEKRTSGNEA